MEADETYHYIHISIVIDKIRSSDHFPNHITISNAGLTKTIRTPATDGTSMA